VVLAVMNRAWHLQCMGSREKGRGSRVCLRGAGGPDFVIDARQLDGACPREHGVLQASDSVCLKQRGVQTMAGPAQPPLREGTAQQDTATISHAGQHDSKRQQRDERSAISTTSDWK
jgi:hypothetical protein